MQPESILSEVIDNLRPQLKGCKFEIVFIPEDIPTTNYRKYPWGYLDGSNYRIYISSKTWERVDHAHKRLIIATLIAPVSSDCKKWKIDRRMWITGRIVAAETAIGIKVKDIG